MNAQIFMQGHNIKNCQLAEMDRNCFTGTEILKLKPQEQVEVSFFGNTKIFLTPERPIGYGSNVSHQVVAELKKLDSETFELNLTAIRSNFNDRISSEILPGQSIDYNTKNQPPDMLTKTLDFHQIKSIGTGTKGQNGFIVGYGATFEKTPDSVSDIIKPGAFFRTLKNNGIFGNGIRMLRNHDFDKVLGVWTQLGEDKIGLSVIGQLALSTQLGAETFELVKMKALFGLSIGYKIYDSEMTNQTDKNTGRKIRILKKIGLFEISVVTFPANAQAQIDNYDSINRRL